MFANKYKRIFIKRAPFPFFVLLCCLILLSACAPQSVWVSFDDEAALHQIPVQGNTYAEVLSNAGFPLGEMDRMWVNGMHTAADQEVELKTGDTLQVSRAYPLSIHDEGVERTLLTSAHTVGQALWENNITISSDDYISLPLDTIIDQSLSLDIRRSSTITIQVDGKEITGSASAQTVGEALAQSGIALEALDYSIPAENEALPADGVIQVMRVSEEIILAEEIIPYETEYVADPELDLDQYAEVEAGAAGLSISRVRVRTENGVEVSRKTEESWIAKSPVSRKTAYGTKITIQSTSTPDGTIEYWRAVTVTAHSYHDTGYRTASGKWPEYGMMAVSSSWWPTMQGTSFYVPGYGIAVVEDKCGACEGNMLIDLFIPTEDYVGWHKSVTLYFLTPVPSNIKYVLP
ncbi:MAG: DUF348 domain-containing protein [Chloroflexi bacterium]|nr:DUF348 domain-containing protein [Chloroflexota bacterium]